MALFASFDKDGSGWVEFDEFKKALSATRINEVKKMTERHRNIVAAETDVAGMGEQKA